MMKFLRSPAFILSCVIILIGLFIIVFNRSVIAVQLQELSYQIEHMNKKQKRENGIDVLFKYEMNRRLYSGVITQDDYDIEQLKVISLFSYEEEQTEAPSLDMTQFFALPAVNAFRMLLQKEPIVMGEIQKDNSKLALAYYYESNCRFRDALNTYSQVPEHQKSATILLHEGYCYSILGDSINATQKLNEIITKYKNDEIAITAAMLLMYINDFQIETERVLHSEQESIELLVKLFRLNSFDNADELISKLENSGKEFDNEDSATVAYYKARLQEERGEKDRSISGFQDVVLKYPKTAIAKHANRRLLVQSILHPQREQIVELAIKNADIVEDDRLRYFVELNNALTKTTILPTEVKSETIKQVFFDDSKSEVEKVKLEIEEKSKKKQAKPTVKKRVEKTGEYSMEYYRADGKIRQINQFDKKGKLTSYYVYVYDTQGNKIRIDTYDADGKLVEYY